VSDVAAIRAAIKAKLAAVADIGKVNDYEVYAEKMSDLKTAYVANIGGADQLRGWHIRRLDYKEIFADLGRWVCHTHWRVRGFMALKDASEKVFDDLIEAACDAFRADDSLGGAVLTCIEPDSSESGLKLVSSGPVLFAGVLCHSADGRLYTQHLK
jgi:hypothetical protein